MAMQTLLLVAANDLGVRIYPTIFRTRGRYCTRLLAMLQVYDGTKPCTPSLGHIY